MGYRAVHRYIVFQAVPHTLGFGPEVWRVLAKCHVMEVVDALCPVWPEPGTFVDGGKMLR